MPAVSTLPSLPLPRERAEQLSSLIDGLDAVSLWWLSGYAAGLASRVALPAVAAPDTAAVVEPAGAARLTILYGSQTGNAQGVAEALFARVKAAGIAARLLRADAYATKDLATETLLYVVVSTQGDGEPPDDARAFMEFVTGRRAPRLDGLAYAVLALGDSSYPDFCAIGRKLDERLAALGGRRLGACAEADLDIEAVSLPWMEHGVVQAREMLRSEALAVSNVTPLRPRADVAENWSAARPFKAEIIGHQRITAEGSSRDVRHVEIRLEGSGIAFQPGDSLGIVAHNPAPLVADVLDTLGLDGDEIVTLAGTDLPLHEWLGGKRELTRVSRPFLAALAERTGDAGLHALLSPERADALRAVMRSTQPIDLLQRHPAKWPATDLVASLRPLAPRLYSIASSRAAVEGEAHLTVAHVQYTTAAGMRWGAASHWIASHEEGQTLDVHLEQNERFRLPADPGRDIIMVGPGTGVAPFRAFVQQRAESGARGQNWLFFGNPHFRTDFLYQVEWQAALENGSLARMDIAFSRDQPEKIHVQQRLREAGRDVFDWLERGAHFYVCGAVAMARGVEAALRDVIVQHGGRTPECADEYLAGLRATHRYARDVY